MATDLNSTKQEHQEQKVMIQGGSTGTVYGLGTIGACIYYIRRASTFRERVLGFLKGLAWPAFLVYDLLEFLHKE